MPLALRDLTAIGYSSVERIIMWKPNRNQWVAFGVGLFPVAVLFLSAMSAFMRNDRQALWPLTVFLGAVIALVTALTISWLEAKR
jgi:fatty acid desaturase